MTDEQPKSDIPPVTLTVDDVTVRVAVPVPSSESDNGKGIS